MGIVNFGPPEELIRRLKETYHITTFIETGTYHGGTAYWASSIFDHVITIEGSESLYKKVVEKYRHIKNIEFVHGDSRERLDDVVARLDGPAIFWLDAHWSGGETYGQTEQGPLIGEIEAINRSEDEHFIFIDDARLFMSPPPGHLSMDQWPNITAVINALQAFKKERYIVIIEDVIVAVPHFARMALARYCQEVNTKLWEEYSSRTKKAQNNSAKPVTVSGKKLVDELRSRIRQLPEAKAAGVAEVEEAWTYRKNRLRQLMLQDDVSNFLNWDVIRNSMFYEPPVVELAFLQKLPNWNKWERAIRESPVGNPKPYRFCASSSGNLIHQAYNLAKLLCTAGCNIEDMSQIFEFGGGYGSMCRLAHQLGFKGRYIIFDLPELSALQEYYLKASGIEVNISTKVTHTENCIVLLSDYDVLKEQLQEKTGLWAFIGTWSISEVPVTLRDKIWALISSATYVLIAYQEQFRGIDNTAYFANLVRNSADYQWNDYPIGHLKNNHYLIGVRKVDARILDQTCDDAKETKPVITMSTLGKNGRFANQVFQYAFLKTYAKKHNLEVRTPPWIGQGLFGHKDPPILRKLPLVKETTNELAEAVVPNTKETFENVDFWGYFQYNTSYYAPHKNYFRSLFRPVPEIENKMSQLMNRLRSKGKTVVGIHLRRSDYGYGHFFVAPSKWYKYWLQDLWYKLDEPVLFIASDEPEKVLGDFAEYNPVTSKDLGAELPEAPFYPDFYILSKCDIVAISNSSFSFLACMLNERGKLFYRPRLSAEALIRFEPWNSETILRDEKVEDRQPGVKRAAEYAKDHIEQLLTEFLELYEKRPIRNNEGGLKSVGAFNLWYFLRRVRPNLVVESGVWKGFSTWLIEETLPHADIICLDPHPEVRQYTSKNAIYPSVDFAEMDFRNYDISSALVFFDDHQNAYNRALQAWEKGFEHLIFDDNYPGGSGSHLTLQAHLSSGKEKAARLRQIIEEYEIFPPLYQYDEPITMEKVYIDIPALDIADTPPFELLKREMDTYRWMTYVRLGGCPELKDTAQGWACPSAKATSVVEKSGKTISEAAESHAEKDSFQYPSFNALVSFLSSRDNYRPTIISTAEVFCGPDCETTMDTDEYRTIKSPAGVYDIEQIAKRLPSSQTPQLVAVKADATGRNFPINLQALKCPKLLILGNTQHLQTPIQALLKYALQEKFDFIMSDHKRHHLHYFKEIGFEKVFWLPAFNISPHKQPYYEDKRYKVAFVGQAGKWHPYRKYILQYLKANGVPVNHFQLPPPKAAEIYAQSLVNLNVSLNGDLNLRVFEVLSSGGFLLTDKLTMESGLELLFKDGQHLVCFENDRDLLDKIQYFLKHPDEAKAIAQNGYEEFERNHTPEKKIKELSDYILSGELNPLYDIEKDKRSIYVKTDPPIELVRRVALYEFFQEVHLTTTSALILFWPEVDGRLACDVLDLPRLRLFIKNDSEQIPDQNTRLFQNTDMAERIKLVTTEQLRQMDLFWNALVITASELLTVGLENLLTSMKFKWLVISDGFDALEEQQKKKFKDILAAAGFEKRSEGLELYYWKDKNLWGKILYSENKIAEAISCFGQALLENPSHCDALNNLGVISCQLEQLENAEKLLLKAVRLNRRNLNALTNLSHLYLRTKRFDDAAELFQEAASLDKDDPSLWFHLGLCYEQSNRNPEALQAYKCCNELGTSEWPTAEKIQTLEKRTAAKRPKRTAKVILPPKRILVINNLYPPQELGGYGRLLYDFTNILENRGHSIYVLTSNTPYLGAIDQDQSNVDRSLLLFGSWQNGICRPIGDKEKILQIIKKNDEKLQNVIKHFSPQLCLLGNIDFLSHSILQPLLKNGIPVIHHLGNSNPGYSVQDTPKSRFYHLATASNWLKEEILKQGYSLHQIGVIYPGALVKEFKMSVLPALDKLRIAYASIILPYKGPHILINALKRLHDMGVDFSCSLAGTSTDEKFVNSLKNFITQAGMDEKVTFPGFLPREDLKNFFARHNVLVFPSVFQEPFGISQVEAMAAGLTVVTSGTGGAKEIVEHRLSGVIFNSEDHESLARELLQLTGDEERWRQIALAGQKRALQCFDIEKSVDDIERIYCHLTQHNENGIEHGRKSRSSSKRYIVGKKTGTPHISPIPLHTNDSNPLVSIIMPAYNAAEYIAEAIESVLIQNYRNFELIIVDDGSTDNTKDIIAGFKDEKIKYFYKENAGTASARNLAMKESKGDFLITLDADDMITPDFIAKHLQQFEKHPETDLVYCDDYLIDEDGKPTRVSERPEYPDRKSLIRDLFRYGCPIVPFRTCIRKSVFDKIGFFDEDLLVGEDYDMMRRFVKSGLKIHHLKDALYLRRITPNNLLRNSTAQNAKCHFEVVKRFADTFAYDELFPDVSWDEIPPEMRQLHAKCLAAATYVAIGHAYIESNSPAYAERASKLACSELNDCLKIDPNNRQIRQLLQKYELLQAKWAEESPTSYSIGKHKINN